MKTPYSLLTRIRRPELSTARRSVAPQQVREAVLEHLQAMCHTRQGTMPVCPDYGVAAVSEMVHAFPEAISLMARTIRQTIQAYEPRLTNVQVRHVPSEDMILRFDITAQIVVEGSKTPVRFETTIDTSRKLSIH